MSIESAPTRYAWLSIAAAIATITLKTGAYWLSGSVGLLSDALESIVNLVAAVMALMMLRLAALPPDEEHAYGHSKAEYFASGVEGALDGESKRKTGVDSAKESVSVQVHRGHGGFHREQREHKVDVLFFSQCSLCQLSDLCVRPESLQESVICRA